MQEFETSRGVILCCDVREGLAQLEDDSVDAIVTDPPYELGFMGKGWDKSGIAYCLEVWQGALRVLKPGGWLVAFGGCRTYHRLACAVEDAGFELRDSLLWLFGQGFPKSLNLGDGRGTALKPAYEPIVLARKPVSEKTVAANVLKWGTGGLNIAGCSIGTEIITQRQKDMTVYHGNKLAAGHQTHMTGKETQTVGRWPANVILQCLCDEVLPGPPEEVHPRVNESSQDERYAEEGATDFAATPGVRRVGGGVIHTNPDCPAAMVDAQAAASRFFYCAKATRKEREVGLEDLPLLSSPTNLGRKEGSAGLDNPRAGAGRTRKEVRNTHPTVKPIDLMRWLVRLVTPPGGLVLDPFCGSGSTLIASVLEQCEYIGVDLDEGYCDIASHRVRYWEGKNETA